MKEELLVVVAGQKGANRKLNALREYLQVWILRSLYRAGFFEDAVFHGGSCLRLVYNLRRFSEDLDFARQKQHEKKKLGVTMDVLVGELHDSGYEIQVKKRENIVSSFLIQFPGLLYQAGLSQHSREIFSIKIELDSRPPRGGMTAAHVLNKYVMFAVNCYDLPTLLAGKVNAVLTRSYVKGRDFFDLFWYRATYPDLAPNFTFLENSLRQFSWRGPLPQPGTWKDILLDRIGRIDWPVVQRDVEMLLQDPQDLRLFSRENLSNLLR